MANAAGAQHALEAPRRSRHHGGEAIVTRPEPMRWGRVRASALEAAGASMIERACGALEELSAERQIHVQFAANLGAVGAAFMQQADMQDAARHDVLQDEAKAILRREGRRKRQIERRSRASQAKSARAGQDQSEPVHRARGDSRSRSSRRRHQSARPLVRRRERSHSRRRDSARAPPPHLLARPSVAPPRALPRSSTPPPHLQGPFRVHIFGDFLMRRIDEIILRNKPENWNLTIQFEEKGMEALDYKYPDDKDYDHVIYCSAGNGMYKPFGKPAWQTLAKNIKSLGKE